jgi:UDP-glucose 4-epimerase
VNELAAALLRVMDADLPARHRPPRTENAARRRVADPALASEELGFRAQVSLEDGLRELVAWCRRERPDARS